MRRVFYFALGAAALSLIQSCTTKPSEPPAPAPKCSDYQKNSNGSWSPKHQVTIAGPYGAVSLSRHAMFWPGGSFTGKLANRLNARCLHHH